MKNFARIILGFLVIASLISVPGFRAQAIRMLSNVIPNQPDALIPSIFGVEMDSITSEGGLDQISQLNPNWIRRNGLLWSDVEPEEGKGYKWAAVSGLESELVNASSLGLTMILVVRSTPTWAQKVPGKTCGPIKQDKLVSFANFMQAAVTRYSAPPYNVKYWEMWNEPDVDPSLVGQEDFYGCWGDLNGPYYGGGYYADMLKLAYPQMKAANPNVQVLIGGLLLDCDVSRVCPAQNSSKFLEGILVNNGGFYFDGVSFHAYDYYAGSVGRYINANWNSAWNTTGPVEPAKATFIRGVLAQYGVIGKYLVNSEVALVCNNNCDINFENTKAYYVAESYAVALASSVYAKIWYSARADWKETALLKPDLSITPAYDAYKFAQVELHEATFYKEIKTFQNVKVYEFNLPDRRVWVIWSLDGNNHIISLPVAPTKSFDVDGTPLGLGNTFSVTLEPYYLEFPPKRYLYMPFISVNYPLILNSGFEQGVDEQGNPVGWTAVDGGLPVSLVNTNPTKPNLDPYIPSGNYSALLGKVDLDCQQMPFPAKASLSQRFRVPVAGDGVPIQLVFDYIVYTQDGSASTVYDRFEVLLNNGSGDQLVFSDGNPYGDGLSCEKWLRIPEIGWGVAQVDLVPYRGQTITITFQNLNRFDANYNTFTYLDNVHIKIGS